MIEVNDQEKVRIARSGANKLFGVDYDIRKNMGEKELLNLFDKVWSNRLEHLIVGAEVISRDEVNRRLLDKYHTYVDPDQEHRSFHYLKAEFIAQLELVGDARCKLTQLWRVASSDTHPKTLFITFSSVAERERFSSLAQNLAASDEELGLKLIRNFVILHPESSNSNSNTIDLESLF